jgi:hypothetical protein
MAGAEDVSPDTSRVLEVALQSVRGDGQTEATIQNAYELIALVGHASMVAAGFRLIGLGEDNTLGLLFRLFQTGTKAECFDSRQYGRNRTTKRMERTH